MKNFILSLVLMTLSVSVKAQDTLKYPETVVIRVYEAYSGMGANENDCFIITTTPDGGNEKKELELVNVGTKGTYQQQLHNQVKIKTEITRWNNQGFSVKGMTQVLFGVIAITTIVLEKS